MFIQLTKYDTGTVHRININHITTYYRDNFKYSVVGIAGGGVYYYEETLEEIDFLIISAINNMEGK